METSKSLFGVADCLFSGLNGSFVYVAETEEGPELVVFNLENNSLTEMKGCHKLGQKYSALCDDDSLYVLNQNGRIFILENYGEKYGHPLNYNKCKYMKRILLERVYPGAEFLACINEDDKIMLMDFQDDPFVRCIRDLRYNIITPKFTPCQLALTSIDLNDDDDEDAVLTVLDANGKVWRSECYELKVEFNQVDFLKNKQIARICEIGGHQIFVDDGGICYVDPKIKLNDKIILFKTMLETFYKIEDGIVVNGCFINGTLIVITDLMGVYIVNNDATIETLNDQSFVRLKYPIFNTRHLRLKPPKK